MDSIESILHIQCHPLAIQQITYSLATYILFASHIIAVNLPKSRSQCSDMKSVLRPFAHVANEYVCFQ